MRPVPLSAHMKSMANSRAALSAARLDGAGERADIFGDVTADCSHDLPELAEAWREGAGDMRDGTEQPTLQQP